MIVLDERKNGVRIIVRVISSWCEELQCER